jgi:hypothetical protein
MSKRIPTGITKEFLESVPLPSHGGRYTAISHKSIIEKVKQKLSEVNIGITHELYRSTLNGNVANGLYILDHESVPGLRMAFIWGNSYDKSMRFKCGIGIYIVKTGSMIFAGESANYSRKHTGTADKEAEDAINMQIVNAQKYYEYISNMLEKLSKIEITKDDIATVAGKLFIVEQAINKEQMGLLYDHVQQEEPISDSIPFYNAWTFYMYMSVVLKMTHPKMWFESHATAHSTFMKHFFNEETQITLSPDDVVGSFEITEQLETPTNQMTIFDVIKEEESKDLIVDIAATPAQDITEEDVPEMISEEAQEAIDVDNILEDDALSGKTNPDEFFDLKFSDEKSFELPDL